MKVGVHVSISGSVDNSINNAIMRNCSAFQIFTGNPRSWSIKNLDKTAIKKFKDKLYCSNIDKSSVVAHTSYLPNLASPNNETYEKSMSLLKNEILKCSELGIMYLITHLGSHLGDGESNGIDRLVNALNIVTKNSVMILLENSAGQRNSIGYNLKQLSYIFDQLNNNKFGICLDTCHIFTAGYNIRTKEGISGMFNEFDKYIGISNLRFLHLNDSKYELNSHVDRHYHIGLGKIGETGLSQIIKFSSSKEIPMILETPIDDIRNDFDNIKKTNELA